MENPKNNIEAYVEILFGVGNDPDVDENLTKALHRIAYDIKREVREIDRLFTAAHHALRPDGEQLEPMSPAEPGDDADEDRSVIGKARDTFEARLARILGGWSGNSKASSGSRGHCRRGGRRSRAGNLGPDRDVGSRRFYGET
jgi:hypothetical protein